MPVQTWHPLTRLRARLSRSVLVLLACQAIVCAAPPVALCCAGGPAVVAADADEECDCGHGDGAICPMHRSPNRRPAPAAPGTPLLCAGCDDELASLMPTLGHPGVIERTYAVARPLPGAAPAAAFPRQPLRLSIVPESPPPRA